MKYQILAQAHSFRSCFNYFGGGEHKIQTKRSDTKGYAQLCISFVCAAHIGVDVLIQTFM